MTTVRRQIAIPVQLGTALLIWVVLILINQIPLTINWNALKLLPSVVSIYAILYIIFIKWLWRSRIFSRWFVVIPDLQGTWKGEMKSTWINPETGKKLPPIVAYLVVRQDLRSIHIKMFSKESTSHSLSAAIQVDDVRGIRTLDYSYSNKPKTDVRERSEIHYGAANLQILTKPTLKLEGDYWTDRKTTGSMFFEFMTKELFESFPDSNAS